MLPKEILNEEVQLLNYALNQINENKQVSYYNTERRKQSSVCIILRLNLDMRCKFNVNNIDQFNRKEPDAIKKMINSSYELDEGTSRISVKHGLELLFIKRAENPRDKFSGQVAFPGGKCENDESDYEAAVREANEECGLNLHDKSQYLYLAPIPKNFFVYPHPKGNLYVSAHIFWQINLEDIKMKTNPSEVAYCMWVPFNHIVNPPANCLDLAKDYNVKLPEGKGKIQKSIIAYVGSDMKDGKAWRIKLPSNDDLWGLTFFILVYFMGFCEGIMKQNRLKLFSLEKYNEIVKNALHFKLGEPNGIISKLKIYAAEHLFYNYRQKQFENIEKANYLLRFLVIVCISACFFIYPRL